MNYLNKVIFEMHEFPELLALKGHDVSFFHYPEAPDEPGVSWRTTRQTISGRVHPEARIRLITPPTFGGGSFERYLAPLLATPALRREIRSGGYDIIVLYAVPTTGWQAVSIAKRAHVPIVYRALDVSHQIRENPLAPLIHKAERYVAGNAGLVSGNNPAMTDYCVRISNRTGPTSTDLPPIDLSHFEDSGAHDVRASLGLTADDKVLLYMGTFFEFSGLDVLIDDLAPRFAEHPELKLVLVGGGELDAQLRATVHERSLQDRVIFTGVVPYASLPGYLASADVAVNPFRPELVTNVALPHKVLQYMAAGVATVSTDLSGLRGVLGDDSGVTLVEHQHDIASVATRLAYEPARVRADIVRRQRDYVDRTFSKQLAVDAFEKTLESLVLAPATPER
ncbi:glycosyltransferase family 4 protein [Leifsonia sp. TF02-11]|uniref:glycosyltransferase family 4 protein n=1 Tax=Leifsonia sp. TF02-11 TaxID=2815212 RepID=UPI0027DC050F|nr:glycosyltransferase family 4 protein [Leifsonia sp. TF02-11]